MDRGSRRGAESVKDEEGVEEVEEVEEEEHPPPISSQERGLRPGPVARAEAAVRKRLCRGRGVSPACHLRSREVLLLLSVPNCPEYGVSGVRCCKVPRVQPTDRYQLTGVVPVAARSQPRSRSQSQSCTALRHH